MRRFTTFSRRTFPDSDFRNIVIFSMRSGVQVKSIIHWWMNGTKGLMGNWELGTYMQANYSFNTPKISPGLSTISSAPAFSSSSLVP